jgi:hypothetical protein
MHGAIIFRDDDETACILIETMDDARALDSVDDRWIFVSTIICAYSESFEVVKECVHECSLSPFFAWCRMSIDSGIFIDDREIIVLKNYC